MNAYKIFLDELRLATSSKFMDYLIEYVGNDSRVIKFDYKQTHITGTFLVYIMTDVTSFHFLFLNDDEDGFWVNKMSNISIKGFYKWMNEEYVKDTHYTFPNDTEHLLMESPIDNLIKSTKKRF